jgi:hypothetical protein
MPLSAGKAQAAGSTASEGKLVKHFQKESAEGFDKLAM